MVLSEGKVRLLNEQNELKERLIFCVLIAAVGEAIASKRMLNTNCGKKMETAGKL